MQPGNSVIERHGLQKGVQHILTAVFFLFFFTEESMKLEKATFDFLRLVIFKLLREIEENLTNICNILQFIISCRGGHCSYPTRPTGCISVCTCVTRFGQ